LPGDTGARTRKLLRKYLDLRIPFYEISDTRIAAEIGRQTASIPVALDPWLRRDALIAALDGEINTEADDGCALSHEQRQQREAEVMGDLLDIERQEAALVWQAQSQKLPCEHRQDISVLALLSISLVTTPRADALPETTPGYSWPMRR
jgi:hypothetical protein